jgi:hypothetical protein
MQMMNNEINSTLNSNLTIESTLTNLLKHESYHMHTNLNASKSESMNVIYETKLKIIDILEVRFLFFYVFKNPRNENPFVFDSF